MKGALGSSENHKRVEVKVDSFDILQLVFCLFIFHVIKFKFLIHSYFIRFNRNSGTVSVGNINENQCSELCFDIKSFSIAMNDCALCCLASVHFRLSFFHQLKFKMYLIIIH